MRNKFFPNRLHVSAAFLRTQRLRNALRHSRQKLLSSLDSAQDVTFIRAWGNTGDTLIFAGIRELLSGYDYSEVSLRDADSAEGEVALISGGGAWCQPFHGVMEAALPQIESRFKRVVVFPSSFDPSVESVREALRATRARIFAREPRSYELVRDLCDVELAHDCAFFFDFRPFRRRGAGVLKAFRTDAESAGGLIPEDNNDISISCPDLIEWLQTIAAHEEVRTDRAHVMIAAAMLGKRVLYRPTTYHKVPAIAEWALAGFPVKRFESPEGRRS